MQHSEILALAGLRIDGRRPDNIRRLQVNVGCCSNNNSIVDNIVDGSSYLEQGLNKVLVMIHGPQEMFKNSNTHDSNLSTSGQPLGIITCQVIDSPFIGIERKKKFRNDRRTKEMEKVIVDTMSGVILLALYPKSEISIVIHVLETDGNVLSCILNAVSIACMDAGIMMSDIITSCNVGVVSQKICIDLNQVEENACTTSFPIAIKANSKDIVYIQMNAKVAIDSLEMMISSGINGCEKIKTILESTMRSVLINVNNV